MSLINNVIDAVGEEVKELLGDIISEAAKLPEEALPYLLDLVKDAQSSGDPTEYIKRKAAADAAHLAAQETAKAVVDARAELAADEGKGE